MLEREVLSRYADRPPSRSKTVCTQRPWRKRSIIRYILQRRSHADKCNPCSARIDPAELPCRNRDEAWCSGDRARLVRASPFHLSKDGWGGKTGRWPGGVRGAGATHTYLGARRCGVEGAFADRRPRAFRRRVPLHPLHPYASSSSPQPDPTGLALTRSRFRLSLGNRRAPLWNEPSLAAPTRQPAPDSSRAKIGMGRTPLLLPPRSPPQLANPTILR